MRNFGFGKNLDSLVIYKIAKYVREAQKNGTASEKKIFSALRYFSNFLRREFEIRDLEKVRKNHMERYALHLKKELDNSEKRTSTTAGYLSALNSIFIVFEKKENVISAKRFGIHRGDRYKNLNKAASDEVYEAVLYELMKWYRFTGDIRCQALSFSVKLQRTGGLRFRESTQIKINNKDFTENIVRLVRGDGVKNGQPRSFQVRDISAFAEAQKFIYEHRHIFAKGSLIPSDSSYDRYKSFAYNILNRINEDIGSTQGFHAFRHKYAHESYAAKWEEMTGHAVKCSVEVGKVGKEWRDYAAAETGLSEEAVRHLDRAIRLTVAEELGHHRVDITNSYLGGHHGR